MHGAKIRKMALTRGAGQGPHCPSGRLGVVLLISMMSLGLLLAAGPVVAVVDRSATIEDMRSIYASIATLLPLSVDDEAFRSPKERERIRLALANIAGRAEHVGSHIAGDDRRIRYLANALSLETQDAMRRFDEGRFESAQFVTRRLTDFCIACHTRIPSTSDSPVAPGIRQ